MTPVCNQKKCQRKVRNCIEYMKLGEFPAITETRKAIQHLSSGKAPGTDAIPAEVYTADGLSMTEKLTELFQCMWRKKAIPQDFKPSIWQTSHKCLGTKWNQT